MPMKSSAQRLARRSGTSDCRQALPSPTGSSQPLLTRAFSALYGKDQTLVDRDGAAIGRQRSQRILSRTLQLLLQPHLNQRLIRNISSVGSCLDGIKKMLRKPLANFYAQEKVKSVRRWVASSHTPDARASHAFVD
jgi:hypothetical protein